MGIETGDTIASLNPLWPLETDPTHEGNDHLQLIKDVIKTTFQGSSGTGWTAHITVDPTEINYLSGLTGNVQDQLDTIDQNRSDLIKRVDTVVEVGQDDASMLLRTNGKNAVVQTWDDGGPKTATVVNYENLLDLVYPIGSVIHSTDAANPGDRLPNTTWVAVAEGRFIASVGTHTDANGDEVTLAAGDILGGEYNHTLTEAEMPSHQHTISPFRGQGSSAPITVGEGKGSLEADQTVQATGGDGAHNNVPPGYAMYIWERTA